MSYNKITSFAIKDTMATSDPLKVIRGKEFDDEFNAIAIAIESQALTVAGVMATPTGGVLMFGGVAAPEGFLLCDGSERSRRTYSALFQIVGTAFGAGDGSNTFNVPNLSGRFPFGGTPGQLGGSPDTTLPAHSHALTTVVTDPAHSHYLVAGNATVELNASATPGVNGGFNGGQGLIIATTTQPASTGITVSTTIAGAGSSPVNTNLPPFVGLSFIIKT